MKELKSLSLQYKNNTLKLLDQSLLPHKEVWVEVNTLDDLIRAIQELKVRGAPLIGLAGALFLAREKEKGTNDLKSIGEKIKSIRPTAINIIHCIDLLLENPNQMTENAEKLFEEDKILCKKIAEHGESLIKENESLLTYCNTGGLATAGTGTALGAIQRAYDKKKPIQVYVCETRPLLQGARLTTWELSKKKIPHTLICDNMAASLMEQKKIQKVFVGADRIALNGDTANKIGTYSLAVLAYYHKVPFYVVAPKTTLDLKCSSGASIPIEERSSEEIKRDWSPLKTQTKNPAFDITPHHLITAWVLDSGIYTNKEELCGL